MLRASSPGRFVARKFATVSVIGLALAGVTLTGCSSAELRARQEQRDKLMQTSKVFCEFVNGDNNPDIDVAINIAMSARCDGNKPFSLTNYKTPSEINGIVYCCGIRDAKTEVTSGRSEPTKSEVRAPVKAPEVAKPVEAAKVETAKPEVKAESKAEAKVESKVETKTESKVETKPEERKPNSIRFESAPEID